MAKNDNWRARARVWLGRKGVDGLTDEQVGRVAEAMRRTLFLSAGMLVTFAAIGLACYLVTRSMMLLAVVSLAYLATVTIVLGRAPGVRRR